MKRNLKYSKQSGNIELAEATQIEEKPKQESSSIIELSTTLPSSYRKDEGILSYSLFCVISGGTVREHDFLRKMENKNFFKKLEIMFLSSNKKDGGLTPTMMQDYYSKICNNGIITVNEREVKLDVVDKIYMLTDVDHYENELKKIIKEQQNTTPKWIISNPDFEIWLYYCYFNNPNEDLKEVEKEKPTLRSSKLKNINGTFNKGGGIDPRKAFEHIKKGVENSKKNYKETDGIPDLFSTQMHIFAEDVLTSLGDEYNNYIRQIQEKRQEMKNKNSKRNHK